MQSTVQKNHEEAKLEGYVRLQRILYHQINVDKRADISKLEEILQQRDINYQMPHNGLTALHLAATNISKWFLTLSFAELSIDRGADPTIANHEGQTVVHWMLSESVYGPKCSSMNGWLIFLLTTIHVKNKHTTNFTDIHGLSHFHAACMINSMELVEFFLNNGVSVDEAVNVDAPRYPGFTPLHLAVRYGRVELVDKLLSHGADVRLRNSSGMTPLHVLVKRNIEILQHISFHRVLKFEFSEELGSLDKKEFSAEMEINLMNVTKIIEKTDKKVMKSVNLFPFYVMYKLQNTNLFDCTRNDINECIDFDSIFWPGYSALHFAAHFDIDIVKFLLEKGADIEAKDAHGVTPLDLCVGRYSVEDIHSIISSHRVWKNILLTDGETKLLDLVLAMREPQGLGEFLAKVQQDINTVCIPRHSPLWPGFSILHLVVTLSRKAMRFRAVSSTPLFVEDFVMTECDRMDLDENFCTPDDLIRIPEMIEACLDLGADVVAQDANGSTPIHLALRRLDLESLYFLLERCPGNSNPTDEDNLSLLHVACLVENVTLVRQLVASGADLNASVASSFQWDPDVRYFYDLNSHRRLQICAGFTPLHVCMTRFGHTAVTEIVKILMDAGADIHAKDADGLTPLHHQIEHCHSRDIFDDTLLSQLITEDCVVDGLSYLHIAAHHKYPKLLDKLLDVGADVNSVIATRALTGFDFSRWMREEPTKPACYSENTPLHMVLKHCYASRHYDVAKILISRGADVLAKDSRGRSPICSLLEVYRYKCLLRLYLSMMSVADEKRLFDEMGLTRLHVACQLYDVEMIRECLESGANVDARIRDDAEIWPGFTPLHVLMKKRSSNEKICEAVRLLMDAGADVTIVNAKGKSPLLMNFRANHIEDKPACMDILWEGLKNIDVNPTSLKGISHFHLACFRKDVNLVERFLKHGVDPNQTVDHLSKYYAGYTALHFAACSYPRKNRRLREKSSLRTIDLLLEYGAKVNAMDVYNMTPLHLAGYDRSLGGLPYKKLIYAGADPRAKNLWPYGNKVPRCLALEDPSEAGCGYLLYRMVRSVFLTCLLALCGACACEHERNAERQEKGFRRVDQRCKR